MDKYVLIVAGGKGLRMGGDLPKQFIPMRGKPLLMHTLEAFHRWDASARIILVLPEDHQPYWNMLCKEIGCKVPHAIVKGGDTRYKATSTEKIADTRIPMIKKYPFNTFFNQASGSQTDTRVNRRGMAVRYPAIVQSSFSP